MPREKDLKRLVRARMRKTGEAYTAARSQLTRARRASPAAKAAAIDYAAMAGMSDEKMQEKTQRTWKEWTDALDRHQAHRMEHRAIAELLHTTFKVGDWWAQMVAVGYERIKGLRARGQRRDGTYEASKSRTYNVPVSELFDAWADSTTRRRWLEATGVRVRTATAPKSLRLGWNDGSIIAVGFLDKGKGKSAVAVQHTRLPDRETADRLKSYWADQLTALGKVLAS